MTCFLVMVIFLGWFASLYFGNPTILYFFVAFSILMNFFSYWYSDKIVLKMSGAKRVSREEHRELWNVLENLCIAAGIQMPKLYIINDPAPNAFATGRDEKHAAVAVTQGLLDMLDCSELEGVLAHELSHIKNRDILIMTIVVVLVGFVTLLSDFLLRWSFFGGANRDRGSGQMQLIMVVAGLVLAILAPIIAVVIQLAVSRKREFLADASAALLTRYPDGLASALRKISGYGGELKRANHAMAHMYIASPFKGKHKRGFFAKMFMTHPPVEERIGALTGGRGVDQPNSIL
ncbi:MAG: M48 family metallopeptidase [Candidatus Pacebacteria bacterium]|nr:M48 family metallopeptidase [Candidatus Paceibacterota bacterium]